MSERDILENCLNCLLGPVLQFTAVLGLPPYVLKCNHVNNVSKFDLKYSLKHFCTGLSIPIFLIYAGICSTQELIRAIQVREDLFDIICIFPNFVLFWGAVGCNLSISLQVNLILDMIKTCQTIIRYLEAKRKKFLTVQLIKKWRTWQYVGIICLQFFMIIFVILYFCVNLPLHTVDKLGHIVCIYIGGVYFLIISTMHLSFITLIREYHVALREHLETTDITELEEQSLVLTLKSIEKLYLQITHIVNDFIQLMNPAMLIWLFAVVIVYICVSYLITMCIVDEIHSVFNLKLFGVESILVFGFCSFVAFVYQVSYVQDAPEDILSYLYKFPISKLTREEAEQVQSIIFTISRRRIIYNVSEIFSLSLAMFATVFGTTLTYVLTIIQFQIDFNKRA